MYEVTYSIEGIVRKTTIPATDSIQVYNLLTNMYGKGKVQIINVKRV